MLSIGVIYFIIIVFSNTLGAISGMGGGVIIKPLFDTIGFHSLPNIAFFSCVAVFVMSIVSIIKQCSGGLKLDVKKALAVSFGSIVGGAVGNKVFELLTSSFTDQSGVNVIQNSITIIVLIASFLYTKYSSKSLHLKSLIYYIIVGATLGFTSTLLGIGGGPINVALLIWCFAMPIKEAAIYSIVTIFFSQLSKLISIQMTTGYGVFDLKMVYYIVPAAIIGGLVGSIVSKKIKDKVVLIIYQVVIVGVIGLNFFNIVQIIR